MTNKLPTPNPITTAQPVSEAVQRLPACGLACRMMAAAHQGFVGGVSFRKQSDRFGALVGLACRLCVETSPRVTEAHSPAVERQLSAPEMQPSAWSV